MKRSWRNQRRISVKTWTELIERGQDAIRVSRELIEERHAQAEKANLFIESNLMEGEDIRPAI